MKSPLLKKLYISPGNAGTGETGENINLEISDFGMIRNFVLTHEIHLVIVGPEEPLVKGIHDFFLQDAGLKCVPVIGPVSRAARLEGSKDFAKEFMAKNKIPTARYKTFDANSMEQAGGFIDSLKPPYVLKADGLAAGKGVLICNSKEQALEELSQMIGHRKFGSASEKVVIEEFLTGIELFFEHRWYGFGFTGSIC